MARFAGGRMRYDGRSSRRLRSADSRRAGYISLYVEKTIANQHLMVVSLETYIQSAKNNMVGDEGNRKTN